MKNKGKIIGIIIMLILIVVFLIGGFVFYKNSDAVRVRKQLDLGEKYLAELDYDQAIVAYETVIEIEPMNVEAYLGLADAYIGKDDYESALTVLQKGYNLTADDEIKAKIDEINEEIERVKAEAEKVRMEEEERKRLEQKELKRLKMEETTPESVKELYEIMNTATDDEIVTYCMENNLKEYLVSYNPTGDSENGIVLDVYGVEIWRELQAGYQVDVQTFSIYYGEKTNGSYETNGKWYVIEGKAEHVSGNKFIYSTYDGEWKNQRPNGVGKLIQIEENYGKYIYNDTIVCEGYAMQKSITDGTFTNGYLSGDFERVYEWDIYNTLSWPDKDIHEYKGTAGQYGEVIDKYEYIKRDGEWKELHGNHGWIRVDGFGGVEEGFSWISYLKCNEE